MKINLVISCVVLTLFLFTVIQAKTLKEKEDCEVCHEVISKFEKAHDSMRKEKNAQIEQAFIKFCSGLKGKEERFCYYIGGMETSATYILGKLSTPFKSYYPALKICQKLFEADPQICDLKYEKKIDLSSVNFKKLKVKDLKKILSDWGEDSACKGCTEKSDYVRVVKELIPKYDPAAAEILKKRDEL